MVFRQLSESPSFKKEDADQLRKQLGLDEPVLVQYGDWAGHAFRGDLGHSLWSDQPVRELLWDEPRESNTEGGLFPAIFGTVLMVCGKDWGTWEQRQRSWRSIMKDVAPRFAHLNGAMPERVAAQ